ncbi:MAG: tyrosine-type recombinase/integrase [Syntrophobacteraceae bacterium]
MSEEQVNVLTDVFRNWHDSAQSEKQWRLRGRHWLTYLVLRFTGARLGEVVGCEDKSHQGIDDRQDVDFRQGEIRLVTLKRGLKKRSSRIVPVPLNVTSEISAYWGHFPDMKGKVFRMTPMSFRRMFYLQCEEAGISGGIGHPHILRHTRAIELLRGGVPVTVVQDLLGHASLTTTAIYLRMSGQEARGILRDRGVYSHRHPLRSVVQDFAVV